MPYSTFDVGRSMFDVHSSLFQPPSRGLPEASRYAGGDSLIFAIAEVHTPNCRALSE